MKPSLYLGACPIKFINYNKFASELMKIEVVPDNHYQIRYAVPNYPWKSLYKAVADDDYTPSMDSFYNIKEYTLKRLFSFYGNVALLFGIDGPAALPDYNEYTFKFGGMIQELYRLQMWAYKDYYRAPDYLVRLSPRTWMLTKLDDWRLIINSSRTKYVYINTCPERSCLVNIIRERGVPLFPRYKYGRY